MSQNRSSPSWAGRTITTSISPDRGGLAIGADREVIERGKRCPVLIVKSHAFRHLKILLRSAAVLPFPVLGAERADVIGGEVEFLSAMIQLCFGSMI